MAREHPTNQYNHKVQKGEKIGKKTFCLVLLNEEMALLKLVTLRSEESSPSSVAAILAINSSGSGRHLGAKRACYTYFGRKGLLKHLVLATWRQMSLRKASLSSWLSTISCTTYLGEVIRYKSSRDNVRQETWNRRREIRDMRHTKFIRWSSASDKDKDLHSLP